jgi:lipopolysaccharide export system protein LptA
MKNNIKVPGFLTPKVLGKLCLIFMLLTLPISGLALKSDDKQPIKIEADNATLDQKQMVTVFTGNAIITKGSLVIHADKGVGTQDSAGNRTLTLDGRPVTFEQLADDGEKIEGQANHFDFNTKTNLAILKGRARVKKGKNVVIGDTLTYNTRTQVYSANSSLANGVTQTSGGRITVILDQVPNESSSSNRKQ